MTTHEFPVDTFDVFVHHEAAEARAIRRRLIPGCGIDVDAASISPYRRRTSADESGREVRREWIEAHAAAV